MSGSAPALRPSSPPRWSGSAARLALGAVALLAFAGPASAAPAPRAAPTPPPTAAPAVPEATIPGALAFINAQLASNASSWRPCKSTATLALAPDGMITVEVLRQSYCEDSRFKASVRELDAVAVGFEVADEIVLRVPCLQEAGCARHWQKKKKRSGGGWVPRTDLWDPSGPDAQAHQVTALEIPIGSDAFVAERLTTALQFIIRSAQAAPEYAAPADPFASNTP